ncbi:recombinase family protein [Ilyobacter polytropus]|uniref:Resolvase domain protein n=1 Tax=Ilyobacter polytropus (strain ATCC 51220 / DSM 2926 / LMG 16218 / CuHBu1) TaxID=572544 RepID=E3H7F1_ILYPC|nr:recombinase family protein [Ilyobacter polytropus]ADO82847.1 Resolvase domain protein [Ilyobacter polytropus DSM 2926]
MNKIAVKYTRVSTNQQDARGSKVEQDKHIEKFAEKENYLVIETFTDTDHGDKDNRIGLEDLKSYLRLNQSIKYVLVYHSDRFTREFRNGMRDLFYLEELGVTLISALEGVVKVDGTYDSLPSLVRLIGAQEDKAKIVKKVTDNMYNYAKTNRYLGGSVLPWLKVIKGDISGVRCKIMVKNEDTWRFYRKVLLDVIRYRNIAKSASVNNINAVTLASWLSMPELIGLRTFGKKGKLNKNHNKGRRKEYFTTDSPVLPALLSKEEYSKIQEIRRTNRVKSREDTEQYIFTNMTFCGCGGKLAGNAFRKGKRLHKYYRCEKCKIRYNAKVLENILSEEILNHPHLHMINDYEFRLADIIDEITEYKITLKKKQNIEMDILSLIIEGLASKDTASKKLKELKKEITDLELIISKKEELLTEEQQKEITEDHIEMLRFFLTNITEDLIQDLKEILNLLIRKIVIEDLENITIKF